MPSEEKKREINIELIGVLFLILALLFLLLFRPKVECPEGQMVCSEAGCSECPGGCCLPDCSCPCPEGTAREYCPPGINCPTGCCTPDGKCVTPWNGWDEICTDVNCSICNTSNDRCGAIGPAICISDDDCSGQECTRFGCTRPCKFGWSDCDNIGGADCKTVGGSWACYKSHCVLSPVTGILGSITCEKGMSDCDGNEANGCECNTSSGQFICCHNTCIDTLECPKSGMSDCNNDNEPDCYLFGGESECFEGSCQVGGTNCSANYSDCNGDKTCECLTGDESHACCGGTCKEVEKCINPENCDPALGTICCFGYGCVGKECKPCSEFTCTSLEICDCPIGCDCAGADEACIPCRNPDFCDEEHSCCCDYGCDDETGKCIGCPQGTNYNSERKMCCLENDPTICCPLKSFYSVKRKACCLFDDPEKCCPTETIWDETRKCCIKLETNECLFICTKDSSKAGCPSPGTDGCDLDGCCPLGAVNWGQDPKNPEKKCCLDSNGRCMYLCLEHQGLGLNGCPPEEEKCPDNGCCPPGTEWSGTQECCMYSDGICAEGFCNDLLRTCPKPNTGWCGTDYCCPEESKWNEDKKCCIDEEGDCVIIDEKCTQGTTKKCGTDIGVCEFGTQTCQNDGTWGECIGAVGPVNEICNDGKDNDCDGKTDCDDSDCSGDPICMAGPIPECITDGDCLETEYCNATEGICKPCKDINSYCDRDRMCCSKLCDETGICTCIKIGESGCSVNENCCDGSCIGGTCCGAGVWDCCIVGGHPADAAYKCCSGALENGLCK